MANVKRPTMRAARFSVILARVGHLLHPLVLCSDYCDTIHQIVTAPATSKTQNAMA